MLYVFQWKLYRWLILIYRFFTISLAYFLVGIVWNFCNGAQGVEIVPNLDFWNDLPKLIVVSIKSNLLHTFLNIFFVLV